MTGSPDKSYCLGIDSGSKRKCKRGHHMAATVAQCRECHRDRARERQQRLRKADPSYSSRRSKAWRAKNPGVDRKYSLKKRYGMSLEDFDVMLEAQGFRCSLCGFTLEAKTSCVDHDHESGTVRAILCRPCNTGLGHFKDSSETLLAAAAYLQRHDR